MKIMKYMLPVLALLLAAACNHDPDPIVVSSTDPAITSHSDVVVNANTINEDFTLVWSPARFGSPVEVEYTVYAKVEGDYFGLGSTTATNYTIPNGALFEAVGIQYTGDYTVTFLVEARSSKGEKASAPSPVNFEYTRITYLWVVGNHQGWEPATAPRLLQDENGVFKGFVQLDGEFKFASQPSWDGTNYGDGGSYGALSNDSGAGNLSAPAGLYYLEVNADEMTYAFVLLTGVSLIGEAVGGWDADVQMTYNATARTWTAIADVVAGKEYKIRFNNVWDIVDPVTSKTYNCTMGGDLTDLTVGAASANITAGSGGITGFTLSLADYPYNMTVGEVSEDTSKLYVANSTNSWNYFSTPVMTGAETAGDYWGVADFTGAAAPQILLARMQSPLGTRFGGSAAALVEYAPGTAATPVVIAAGVHFLYADMTNMKLIDQPVTSISLIGGFNGWDTATAVDLVRQPNGKWTATQAFAEDGEFKLIINGMWNTVVDGITLQTTMGGSCTNLVVNGGNLVITAGSHDFELDMTSNAKTLAIDGVIADLQLNPDYLEVTGSFAHYNWNNGDPSPQLLPYKNNIDYAGFVDMYKPAGATGDDAGFKITYPNWSTWLGGALQAGTTYDISASGGDMTIPYGLYFWTITGFNAAAKTGVATALPITSIGLIGSVNGTGWGGDVAMTPAGNGIYTLTANITDEFKVRFNASWDYNIGGGALTAGVETTTSVDGPNFTVPAAGNYLVTVNLAKSPNTITVVAQ